MKTFKLSILVALCFFSVSVSAKDGAHRFYTFVGGDINCVKQYPEKMHIMEEPEVHLFSSPRRETILSTQFQGGFGLGFGYEFKENGFNRIEFGIGYSRNSIAYDDYYKKMNQSTSGGFFQLNLVWTEELTNRLRWIPTFGIGYGAEGVSPAEIEFNGTYVVGVNSHIVFGCLSPLAVEYKVNEHFQFQFSFFDAGLVWHDQEGGWSNYFSSILNINNISTTIVYRF